MDDKFYSHRKVRRLSKGAVALWVMAGAYCADHLTDGVIQPSDVDWLGGTQDEADELVDAGMWDEHPDGYEFHDWAAYQPSRSKVEENRAKERERIANWRAAKKQNGDTSLIPVPSRPSYGVTNGSVTPLQPADPETVSTIVAQLRSTIGGHK